MSDNELDHDLSAWEAPPAPAGIADAVLARMDGTGVVPAVPGEPRSGGRRTMLIAGVAVACLAASAGAYLMIASSRPSGPASGAIVATSARTLSLGGATAELDAGADVRWQRHGDVLNVEQRAGNAAWRVDKDMQLLIDAGVTVASVDASGASLRVEVQMNSMDAKILGGSAVTASIVSLVAVTVYSGHVKVHDGGQTVIVKPGTTYSVTPVTVPPPTPDLVGSAPIALEPANPASTTTAPTPDTLDSAMIRSVLEALQPQFHTCLPKAPGQSGVVTIAVKVQPDGTVSSVRATSSYADAVSGCVHDIVQHATFPVTTKGRSFAYPIIFKASPTVGEGSTTVASARTGLTRQDISETIAGVRGRIQGCASKSSKSGKVKVKVVVRPDGKVGSLATMETFDNAVSGCILDIFKTLQFPPTDDGGSFSYPFVITGTGSGSNAAPVASATCDEVSCVLGTGDAACCAKYKKARPTPPPACDAEEAKQKGMENVNMGQHAAALAQFEASLRCKADPYVLQLAFMSACTSKNVAKARLYFPKLTPTQQTKFLQICTRNGIDPVGAQSASTCDANALKEEGMEAVNLAQHAQALAKFEASLACKADPYVVSLAYMSSCSSKNATKARMYYAQLSAAQQSKFAAMCTRNGIDPTSAPTKPAACDAAALKDKGMEQHTLGKYTEAMATFEAAYRCKADPTLPQMIAREACSAHDAVMARTWYARLPAAEQKQVNTFCVGEGIKLLDPGTVPSGMGYLVVLSTPAARIFVDGKDTGLTTPIRGKTLQLRAGDHKVTYLLPSGERFTYKVAVPGGGAVTLSKNLE